MHGSEVCEPLHTWVGPTSVAGGAHASGPVQA